jgi:acetylornithine deacetylase/succinyl-diaminopimelate desuccinylase-like protein
MTVKEYIEASVRLSDEHIKAVERLKEKLEELLADIEEQHEPAEPLIKDEKIRKAVRAWAEANGITEVEYDKAGGTLVALHKPAKIKFNDSLDLNANEWAILAIAELCGEEEE